MRIPKNSNPAMRALGIPSFEKLTKKLPSRNWLIFFSLVGGGVSAYFYDQSQIKKIRAEYIALAERESCDFGKEIPTNVRLRKIKIVVAPLPDDYLESTLKVWRRYIKPVIWAGGLDYELVLGDQQGKIRETIANSLRDEREKIVKKEMKKDEPIVKDEVLLQKKETEKKDEKEKTEEDILVDKILNKQYDVKNVLGVFYKNDELKNSKILYQDALQEDQSKVGGVLCLGRGAYKEYLNGLQEGLLGPLEQTEYSLNDKLEKEEKWRESKKKQFPDKPVDELSMPDFIKKNYIGDSLDNTDKFEYPPKEFVKTDFKDPDTGILSFCKQPILLIAQPALYGIVNWPPRIYNFFTQRYLVEEYCRQALAIVKQDVKNIENLDELSKLGEDVEEVHWPKKWVKKGVESGSEWVQPIKIDDRIVKDLKRYKTDDIPYLYSKEKNEINKKDQ